METNSVGSESLQEEGGVDRPESQSLQEVQLEGRFPPAVPPPSDKRLVSVPSLHSEDIILRTTSVGNILRKGGSILRSSSGSAETYLLSKPAQCIEIFISHNWVVPRWKKFWALTLHFNVLRAVVVAYSGVAIGCWLNSMSIPPVLGPYCAILGSCGFWLTLLLGHDLPLSQRLCCQRQVFLDKICIHQTDPELKAAGINNLGAFLRHSKKMLVLYNPAYCERLWTVYEMACYMYLHPRDKLELLPVGIASVVLKSAALITLVYWFAFLGLHYATVLSIGTTMWGVVRFVIGACLISALAVILRNWGLMQSALFADLRSFQIAKAGCSDERDRAVVGTNICAFVRSMGLVDEDASDADALLSFDKLVQERMPESLRSALGYVGFPYKYALIAGMGQDFYTFDVISSMRGISVQQVASWVIYALAVRAAAFPCVFLICGMLGRACRPRSGWAEVGVKCGIATLAAIVTLVLFGVFGQCRDRALHSLGWLLTLAAACVVLVLVVVTLFSWRPRATDLAALALAGHGGSTARAAT